MTENTPQIESVSIWIWVGMVLFTFGAIILGTGICQLRLPTTTVLGNLRLRIWWGAFMIVTSIPFFVADRAVLLRLLGRGKNT